MTRRLKSTITQNVMNDARKEFSEFRDYVQVYDDYMARGYQVSNVAQLDYCEIRMQEQVKKMRESLQRMLDAVDSLDSDMSYEERYKIVRTKISV